MQTSTLLPPAACGAVTGWWTPDGGSAPEVGESAVVRAVHEVGRPVQLVEVDGRVGVARGGIITLGASAAPIALTEAARLLRERPQLLHAPFTDADEVPDD